MRNIRVPSKVGWTLGILVVLAALAGATLAVTLVLRRERALQSIPLEQPEEVVPVLRRDILEKSAERALNALSSAPITPSPPPSPGPS